jgi:hypothetical protein
VNRRLSLVQASAPIDWLGERITAPRRFQVSVTRSDGTTENYQRIGGSSIDHTTEAIDKAGIGGVVRVTAHDFGDRS